MTRCPFLGAWWDSGTHHSFATEEGRCYATVATKRYLLVLKKEVPGGRVSLDHQKKLCFADYAICPHCVARNN